MKAFKFSIILLVIFQFFPVAKGNPGILATVSGINRAPDPKNDAADINDIAGRGLKYLSAKPPMPEKARSCIDSAVLICEKLNIETPARLHLLMAEYHYVTGDLRSASEEAESALKKSASSGESEVLAMTNMFLGKYYEKTGLYRESMEYYSNSIAVAGKNNLKGLVPRSYLGQATVYNTIGDIQGYRNNLRKMIDAGYKESDTSYAIAGLWLLGTSFCGDSSSSSARDFRQADSILKISLTVSLERKDSLFIGRSLANIGWNYYLEKMFDPALASYEKSLRYSVYGKYYELAANALGNMGTIYRDMGEIDKSIAYYVKGIAQAKKVNDVFSLWWIYRDMSDLYLRSNDTSNAYRNYVLFKSYSDIWMKQQNSQGLADARIRYEADSHKKEVELLSLRLKNNRLLNFGFAGIIILTVVIGLLLFRGSKLKDRRRISEMNRKISEITQANLRQQMNPHFIFNTLNSIQYYMYQHDKLATNNYLTKFSNLMRKVLDNSQHTSVPLNDELSALNLYLELECIRFKDKFEFKINIDEEIDPLMYKVPTMLIQPYVENSICHGLIPKEGKGFVKIDISLKKDYLLCNIEDNGIGRDASKERNNRRESNHNSLGTQITASRLDLVNSLYGTSLKTIYTDLKNEMGEAVGTNVEIHIPIIS